MTKNHSRFMADYLSLAEASYSNFAKAFEINPQTGVGEYRQDKVIDVIASAKTPGEVTQDTEFAKLIIEKYKVVAHWEDKADNAFMGSAFSKESGFSGTLFESREVDNDQDSRYVLALKGTNGGKDLLVTDVSNIAHDGLAHHQIVDLYNFWQQITANDNNYNVAEIRTDFALTALYNANPLTNFEYFFVTQGLQGQGYFIDNNVIKQIVKTKSHSLYQADDDRYNALLHINAEDVVVVGHSLGGHLSAAFARLFPDSTEHAYMVNGAGFGAKFNAFDAFDSKQEHNIQEIFSILGGADQFDKGNITNITGDKNINFVAQDWLIGLEQPGEQPELFIESAGAKNTFGHSSSQMSDSASVMGLFLQMDSNLVAHGDALKQINPLFEAAAMNDNESLENILYSLHFLYRGDAATKPQTNDRSELYKSIHEASTLIANQTSNTQIVTDLSDIFQQATELHSPDSMAYRYALKALNPYVVTGVDYSAINGIDHNALQKLEKIDDSNPKTADGMSEQYILDRSLTLSDKILWNTANAEQSNVHRYYHDEALDLSFGNKAYYDEKLGADIDTPHYLFGSDNAEKGEINGDKASDHIYGAGGDDIIHGGNNADYIEGNRGNDRLFGDQGNDRLLGGIGQDTLKGGHGNDTLVGGQNQDILYGGQGDDTYVFNLGDGQDRISDQAGNTDKLILNNLSLEDLLLTETNNDWTLNVANSKDQIVIELGDNEASGGIEYFEIDGKSMDYQTFASVVGNNHLITEEHAWLI